MFKKIIIYIGLIISSLVIIGMFVTATSYLQLGVAIICYPLFVYFIFKSFLHKIPKVNYQKTLVPPQNQVKMSKSSGGITDTKKRDFLKIIGTAGISFFLFSLFSRKKEIPFIGQLTGGRMPVAPSSGGDKNDTRPTDDYQITEIDEGEVAYYGFTDMGGAWFIMKENSDTGSFRYYQGDKGFSQNWNNREKLKYDYFYKTF